MILFCFGYSVLSLTCLSQVAVLFRDHTDLLVEFTHFLPDTSATPSIHSVKTSARDRGMSLPDKVLLRRLFNPRNTHVFMFALLSEIICLSIVAEGPDHYSTS